MGTRRALGVIAGLVLLVGLVLALLPLSVDGGAVDCGSAFMPSEAGAFIADVDRGPFSDLAGECEAAVSARRYLAYGLAGAGGLVLLFLWLSGPHRTRWDSPAATDEAEAPPAP